MDTLNFLCLCAPVLSLAALNGFLAFNGERGTLLVPSGAAKSPGCSSLVLSAVAAARSRERFAGASCPSA
jgi:hypothetical protein